MNPIRSIVVISTFAGLVWTGAAHAQTTCGTFTADAGNNIIAVGQASDVQQGQGGPLGWARVCWRDSSSVWHYQDLTGCDVSDVAGTYLQINGKGGNDIIGPHVGTTVDCTVEGSGVGAIHHAIVDWDTSFGFGINAWGGTGPDTVYGTGYPDILISTEPSDGEYVADSAIDALCGYAGNDDIRGDEDDSSTYYECMFAGAGSSDVCDGDYAYSGGSTYDYYHSTCETHTDSAAMGSNCSTYSTACTASTAPVIIPAR